MSDGSCEARTKNFLRRLTKEIDSHTRLRRWDSGLYQFLVIGSAIAGFASLSFGLIAAKENNFGIGRRYRSADKRCDDSLTAASLREGGKLALQNGGATGRHPGKISR